MKHKYTIQQVEIAVKQSLSIAQTLKALGVEPRGGNYKVFHRFMKEHQFDTSHFTGKLHSKGKVLGPRRDTQDYVTNKFPINSFRLKNRLLEEGLLQLVCNCCKGTVWMNKPMPLELEHKNGDSEDNRLENLELLCPNCHSFTATYRGRNKKSNI